MLKKLIALCVTVCVLFAPMASNAGMLADTPAVSAHQQMLDCHTGAMPDMHGMDGAALDHSHPESTHAHACCISLAAIVDSWHLPSTRVSTTAPIGSEPTLGLGIRLDDLFRPPRQIS